MERLAALEASSTGTEPRGLIKYAMANAQMELLGLGFQYSSIMVMMMIGGIEGVSQSEEPNADNYQKYLGLMQRGMMVVSMGWTYNMDAAGMPP